jgi:quinolinate synthase
MDARIRAAREILGEQCVVLGHHYQRDEVIQFSDYRGDSWRLSELASQAEGRYILFCGVHFMAESADVLARPDQVVILPDLNAGCSMADMAEISQVEDAWDQFVRLGLTTEQGRGITPLTYMNSAAAIKAFVGERGGAVCTSSNATAAMHWAFASNEKIFFLPDQHLGRNTGYAMDIPLDEMVVWDPYQLQGGQSAEKLRKAKVILWKGHCSVHQRFLPEHADRIRERHEGIQVVVHPECRWEVCQKADDIGSTDKIRRLVSAAPAGAKFAIGTEIHLVNRLAKEHPDKMVVTLNDSGCLCTTMYRISPQHLAWALENLVEGNVVNQVKVRPSVKHWAKVALDRMLQIKG